MTDPTYSDADLAAAEAEVPAVDPADTERVPPGEDTEAEEIVLTPDTQIDLNGDEAEDEVVSSPEPSDDAPAGGDA